jgi:hypothetical protein
MLATKRIFSQLRQRIALIILAALVWLIGLPMVPVQADGYYSVKDHKFETSRPYYATQERRLANTEASKPDYSTKERYQGRANIRQELGDEYIESGRRAGEVIPKDLGTGSRQKNPINMLKRAGEELGNDQIQRAFGARDYERSDIEKELARNKAARGDVD